MSNFAFRKALKGTVELGSKFVTESMKGRFDDTVVIVACCSCLLLHDLARAFIDKGASCYITWDRSVKLEYMDEASAHLVEQLCQPNISIEEALRNTMTEKGPDPKYRAILKYYPRQSGDRTLEELSEPKSPSVK